MPYLGIFGLEFKKNYCHIWNQHLGISVIAKLCEETKMPKFGTKNAIKLLSYLKSAPSNVSICKISQKKQRCLNLGPKMPYLGIFDQKCLIWVFLTKNALFGYFWDIIFKILLSYLKSAPSNFSNCKNLWKKKNT